MSSLADSSLNRLSYQKPQCRMTRSGSHAPNDYNRISCTNCYNLLVYVFPNKDLFFNTTKDGYILGKEKDGNGEYKRLHPWKNLETFKVNMEPLEYDKWRSCCDEAKKCCSDVMLKELPGVFSNYSNSCQSIWDGRSCHQTTPAGNISQVKCPDHFIADTCNSILDHAYFHCNSNGSWYKNEYGEYVDYSQCLQSILPIKHRLINVNIVCHILSLIFLIAGLAIFFSYRQLRVNRINLHKNFFFSLILHSLLQIIWESVIMKQNLTNSAQYIDSNHVGCIITNLLLQYSRSTNYFWMLSESFYLHRLLIKVFKEQSDLYIYYFIGWGVPFILCSIYAICTLILNNNSCWTGNIYLIYILNIPNIMTILLNLIFLINIVRVLYKKLTASNTNEPHQYRRAVRGTLILVPLFGLHLILSPYVMCESAPGSQIHNLINRLIESLQGFVVALIYCFFNSEVVELLKKTLIKVKVFNLIHLKNEACEMSLATSDYDYGDADNVHYENPLMRLKTLLLRKSSTQETTIKSISKDSSKSSIYKTNNLLNQSLSHNQNLNQNNIQNQNETIT